MCPMSFDQLGLSSDLLQAVNLAGYREATAVQAQAIPLILKGKDAVVCSRTGTGKTASYALPILQLLQALPDEKHRRIKALILTPTRELAMQVNSVLKIYGRNLTKPLRSTLIVGGLNIDVQLRGLMHGADMVVATPGRLLDVVVRQKIDFSALKCLVIDEADKMLDLGFAVELESVLNLLPRHRQNLLFSATMSDKVRLIASRFMPQAEQVDAGGNAPAVATVVQRIIEVNRTSRGPLLRHLIQSGNWPQALIFAATVRGADVLTVKLNKADILSHPFHAGLTQAQRTQVLRDFKHKRLRVLVATDLAARGIDIDQLPYVVNYDLPRSPDDYIHRIGRTARAGAQGVAITFVGHEDKAHFSLIEKRMRLRNVRESIKGFELTGELMGKVKGKAPVKGSRMSKKDKLRAGIVKKEE